MFKLIAVLTKTLLLGLLFISQCVAAKTGQDATVAQTHKWNVSIALGAGHIDNPVSTAGDIDVLGLPSFSYYGDKFFIENLTLGYTLFEEKNLAVDLNSRLNLDGIFFYKQRPDIVTSLGINPAFFRIEPEQVERDLSYMGGIAVNHMVDDVELSARFYTDISDVHGGHEFEFTAYYPANLEKWHLAAELIVTAKSQALVDYYYQFKETEGIQIIQEYNAEQGATNYGVKLMARRSLSPKWSFVSQFSRTRLGDAIVASPLIEQRYINFYFIGLEYNWL